MPKTRVIRPSFWEDETVCGLSRDARLLFIGLWVFADDAGRLVWDPVVVREQVFPVDLDVTDAMVVAWMDALTAAGLVQVYPVGRRLVGQVAGWAHLQVIARPKPSVFPDPPVLVGEDGSVGLSEASTVALTEPSLLEGKGREGKGTGKGTGSGEEEQSEVAQIEPELSDSSAIMSEPASQPPTSSDPQGEVDEGSNGAGLSSADDNTSSSQQHAEDSEEDDMGLYDEKVDDPFAAPAAVARLAAERPSGAPKATAGTSGVGRGADGESDAQTALPLPPVAAVTTGPVAGDAPTVKKARKPRKKKSDTDGEQAAIYPPEVDALCEHLLTVARANVAEYVSPNQAKRLAITEGWRDAADKLMRLDEFTYEQILALIDWTASDQFWRTNIRSMPTLREKVDRLAMDQRFLSWARTNRRPTKAAANGAAMPTTPGPKTRAVDRAQVRQEDLTEEL